MDEQDWMQVVAAATRAPSIHNTQPWRFIASADQVHVFLDPERSLPVLDPSARQQVISCGSAVEFAFVALAAAGRAAEVEVLPDAGDPDRLATIRVTGDRTATAEDRALGEAIDRRHTVRAPFQPRAVPEALVDRLQAEARAFDTWVKPITRSEEEVATVFLISRAEEMEQGDPAYVAELQRWLRTDPAAVDGVPVEAVPSGDPHARPSNWLIRDFVVGDRDQHPFLAVRLPRLGECRGDFLIAGHVGFAEDAADFRGDFLALVGVAVEHRDLGAAPRQLARRRLAEPRRRAGNHR